MASNALNRLICFSMFCGCSFASASNVAICATTAGGGVGTGLLFPNIEPNERDRVPRTSDGDRGGAASLKTLFAERSRKVGEAVVERERNWTDG